MRLLFAFLLIASCALAQPKYDLLLKGGHVIDAKNGISAIRDVAIAGGHIAAVTENIAPADARKTIDVSSLYVTPGLVDIHEHVFSASVNREKTGEDCVRADSFSFRNGVTTIVDPAVQAGGILENFAMLNIVGSGMGGRLDVEQNTKDVDPVRTAEVARRNHDVVVCIKGHTMLGLNGSQWIVASKLGGWRISP